MTNAAAAPQPQNVSKDLSATPLDEARLFDAAEKSSDELIRMVMIEQKREESKEALPDLAPPPATPKTGRVETRPTKAKAPKPERRLFKRKAKKAPAAKAASKGPGLAAWIAGRLRAPVGTLLRRIGSYRPTPKHVFFAGLAVIFVLRPWLIPITLLIIFLVVLIAYLSLGPDRVTELVVGAWLRLRARKPELAETVRQRAEAMAKRIDATLDRLPAKWTDGLYVPDFCEPEERPDRPDPFDRLAKEAQHG